MMATAAPETVFVPRSEFHIALEALRREVSAAAKTHAECRGEIAGKLDTILNARMEEARSAGGVEAKMDELLRRIDCQNAEIEEIRKTQSQQGREIEQIRHAQRSQPELNQAAGKDAPVTMRDIVRVLLAFAKLLLAAALGYAASNHHWKE